MILARGTPGFSGAELQNMVKCVLLFSQKRSLTPLVQLGRYSGSKRGFQRSHSETL